MPATKTLSIEEARSHFSDVLNRAEYRDEQTVVARRGKPIGAIISMRQLEVLNSVIEELENEIDIAEARKALESVETEGTVSHAQVKAELGL